MPPGPEAKPPAPSTTAGRCRRSASQRLQRSRATSRNGAASERRPRPCRAGRRPTSHSTGCPAAAPAAPPCRAACRATRCRSRGAQHARRASAGNTWPPVPPAMINATRRLIARRASRGTHDAARHRGLVIDAQQDAEPAERDQHAAAAVAEERQRQALGRQQAHVHADVDERLQAEPDADRRGEVRLERACPPPPRCAPILSARPTSTTKSPMTSTTPARPSSSAITANTKSVCASGR